VSGQLHFPTALPTGKSPCTHWIGGWVSPRVDVDDMERESSWPHRDLNSDPSVVQSVANRYTDYAIPAPSVDREGERNNCSAKCPGEQSEVSWAVSFVSKIPTTDKVQQSRARQSNMAIVRLISGALGRGLCNNYSVFKSSLPRTSSYCTSR
jgi:hypothetical protein